jgi:hypothetical protein
MRIALSLLIVAFAISGCKKDPEVVTFTGNTIPSYNEVPLLLIENYVNRVYIDLIGREPTDDEMTADVAALDAAGLTADSRSIMIDKLMTGTTYLEGDSSYAHAYSQKFYDDNKARFLDGLSESEVWEQYYLYYTLSVQDSMLGNMLVYELEREEANKVRRVLDSRQQFRRNEISVQDMSKRMCFNVVYDNLHMNTFNFINATFDDLFFRFPTDAELDEAYEPIEQVPSSEDPDLTGYLFGEVFSDKEAYVDVLTGSDEFSEGMIRWAYITLLSREPTVVEVYNMMPVYNNGDNIRAVQKSILMSDEYAGFN